MVKLWITVAGIAALAVYMAAEGLLRVVHGHVLIVVIGICAAIIAMTAVLFAFIRGLGRHTNLVIREIEPPRARPQLPAPATPRVTQAPPVQRTDPFSADGKTWAQLVEEEERAELLRRGPREARPVHICKGISCYEILSDHPWAIDVEREDGQEETYLFCSRQCLEEWHQADVERAGRSGAEG
jgi:hypothetical protein